MRLIIIALTLFCSLSVYSQEYGTTIDPSKGFSQKLKEAGDNTQTIFCNFTQVKSLAILAKPNQSAGKFYFKKEQNICLDYSTPKGNLIVMSGGKFKIVVDGKKTVVDMKSNPMMRQMGTMLTACMTGDLTQFGSDSKTEYYETPSTYTVVISPINKKVKKYLKNIVLIFDKKDLTLNSMTMHENETDYTRYEFSDKKVNSPVEIDKFKI